MKIEMPSIVFFCPLQKQETVRPRPPLPLITMPTCQKDEEDRELILTLMAMDAGEEFWYNKEELKAFIQAAWKKESKLPQNS